MKQLIYFFLVLFIGKNLSQSYRWYYYGFGLSVGFARTIIGFTVYMLSACHGFTSAPVNFGGTFFLN